MRGGRTHGGPTRLRVTVAWQATVSELHEQLRVEQTARLRAEENAAAIMVQQEQRNEARPSPCTLTGHHPPPPLSLTSTLVSTLPLALTFTVSFALALSFALAPSLALLTVPAARGEVARARVQTPE